jgi:sulfite reductase beta subunit-like hemoprotein
MVRGRLPGGRLNPDQYLGWDAMADHYGDGTLRLTTRQSLELHGVVKGDLKSTLKGLHLALSETQGACGDVVRNVTLTPNPWKRADLELLEPVAELLSRHFMARSRAYAELWLDGEKLPEPEDPEPLYGALYLPRKFKIGLTAAGENLVDIYTNDLGLAATFQGGGLEGFFLFAGGGMAMSHNDPTTFPRLGDLLGWLPAGDVLAVAEAVVKLQRDEGNREDRRHARFKYLVQARGPAWILEEVERRSGARFQQRDLPPWRVTEVLGWLPRTDGTWAYGLHVPSGRIGGPLKKALRTLVATRRLAIILSPDQDLLLLGILADDREAVAGILREAGAQEADALARRALACVALPLCGLAITEGERVLPEVLRPLRAALARHGRLERAPVFRITGCPNGCARTYSAELALVGQAVGRYALYAGGSPVGDRLAFEVKQKVSVANLPDVFEGLVAAWAELGEGGESFGAFAARLGPAALGALLGTA